MFSIVFILIIMCTKQNAIIYFAIKSDIRIHATSLLYITCTSNYNRNEKYLALNNTHSTNCFRNMSPNKGWGNKTD